MKRLIVLIIAAALAGIVQAETVKGRIAVVSKQAGTIQIDVKGKDNKVTKVVVRTDAKTAYDGAAGLKDLGPPDLIEVQREPGKPASSIKKIVFGLPPGVEIGVQELVGIMTGGQPYHLFDARPGKRFGGGHVPGAKSAFPKDKDFLDRLPADKDALLVFYCGGPTCPYTGVAVKKAQAAGYSNLKGFQAGLPGWKKGKLPVHSEAGWLAKKLNPQHVILDVRDRAASAQAHIPGAVALPTAELQALTQQFIADKTVAELPGVSDQRAPVIVYADSHTSPEALLAYKELRNWGYGKTTILNGGLSNWQAKGMPVESGAAATQIVYIKKLAPGAIAPKEFVALQQSGDGVVLIDVRTAQEAAAGVIDGALHMPLEQLEDRLAELPADKEVLIYCANGIRAEMAHQTLTAKGIRNRYLNETVTIAKDGSYKI
ncbi:MAG: rhodanese-like domain-containing protein [Gammaproteobacteria bacterium]|nr:rhodanese-like domain-containing protein [Gammaproteobacteria bacterium]